MKILITGGAGFVGSWLARSFKEEYPSAQVVVFDNLKRRGSEKNIPIFKKWGIHFVYGDIRHPSDLDQLKNSFDFAIEAAAEPSVLAGVDASPQYALDTNLSGTMHLLEWARKRGMGLIYLSTSRVYSIGHLRKLRFKKSLTRYQIGDQQDFKGAGQDGIAEDFSTQAPRSLYGGTKLASEILVEEYAQLYGLRAWINRCGVITGPGQFGKTDQGVFAYWMGRHYFNRPLFYTGFKGEGRQVRDILHPHDLYRLIRKQALLLNRAKGDIFNIGGGNFSSVSLREWTEICRAKTGNVFSISPKPKTNPVDVPWYISNFKKASSVFNWKPKYSPDQIATDIYQWIKENKEELRFLWD